MGQPHKHAVEIKAWADGEAIEYFHSASHGWFSTTNPSWNPDVMFRVKPKNITVKRNLSFLTRTGMTQTFAHDSDQCNIEYTFDPEGKLLDAKVLK